MWVPAFSLSRREREDRRTCPSRHRAVWLPTCLLLVAAGFEPLLAAASPPRDPAVQPAVDQLIPPLPARLELRLPPEPPPPLEFDLELDAPEAVVGVILRNAPELVRAEATRTELLFAYGYALWRAGAGEAAREPLETYLAGEGILRPYAALLLGGIDLAAGRLRVAERRFERAIDGLPEGAAAARARLGLLEVTRARGHVERAIDGLRALLEQVGSSEVRRAVALELAGALVAMKDYRGAIARYEALWAGDPLSEEARAAGVALEALVGNPSVPYRGPPVALRLERARRLLSLGGVEEGVQAMASLAGDAEVRGQLPRTFPLELGKAYFQAKAYAQAYALFEQWARGKTGGERAEALYWLGMTRGRLGDHEGAIERYEALAGAFPASGFAPHALFKIGLLRLDEGKYDLAETAFQHVLDRFPRHGSARNVLWYLAWTQLRQGKFEEAVARYDTFIRRFPNSTLVSGAQYWQGRIALAQERKQDAIALFTEAACPGRPSPYAAFARILLEGLGVSVEEPVAGPKEPESAGSDVTPPPALQRAEALSRLGLRGWAREEVAAVRASIHDRAGLLDLGRWYQRVGDFAGAARLAHTLGLDNGFPRLQDPGIGWRLAYPRAFASRIGDLASPDGVPANLIYAIMRQESLFDASAVSRAGARGPLQLMPATAAALAEARGLPAPPVKALHDPAVAARYAAWLLASQMEHFGHRLPLAIAAYNAGVEAVERWLEERPVASIDVFIEEISYSETRRYVRKVLANLWVYSRLYGSGVRDFAVEIGLSPDMPSPVVSGEKEDESG